MRTRSAALDGESGASLYARSIRAADDNGSVVAPLVILPKGMKRMLKERTLKDADILAYGRFAQDYELASATGARSQLGPMLDGTGGGGGVVDMVLGETVVDVRQRLARASAAMGPLGTDVVLWLVTGKGGVAEWADQYVQQKINRNSATGTLQCALAALAVFYEVPKNS